MEESEYAAIAKLTMHQREHIVVVRPRSKGMTLHTMFYTNEIREVAEYGKIDAASEPKPAEKKLAEQLIESLAAPFEPSKYKDNYMESMQKMIEAKRQGQEIATAEHPKLAPVIDLMEALKKSIAEKTPTTAGGKKPPQRTVATTQAQAAAPEKKRKKSSAG
jgi:DNA end-binding protein Ku